MTLGWSVPMMQMEAVGRQLEAVNFNVEGRLLKWVAHRISLPCSHACKFRKQASKGLKHVWL